MDNNNTENENIDFKPEALSEQTDSQAANSFPNENGTDKDTSSAAETADTAAEAESEDEKVEIIGVRFKKSGKIYFFDPDGMKIDTSQNVIVETARGLEYGNAVIGNRMVDISELVLPLRKVLRIASSEDEEHRAENAAKEIQAYNTCIEKIENHHLSMKLVDVEYTFDNNKLLFYFTAEGRIDFRELVKDLASVFRTRIELRQIGIRDEAKMMGGLGICGRPFCCHSFLSDFVQVSIKMAKEQNLSLNSSKISGACGRLMCCLRYEYDTYDEELRKMPALEAIVHTPDGDGIVTELNPLAHLIKVRLIGSPEQPKVYDLENVVKINAAARHDDTPAQNDISAKEASSAEPINIANLQADASEDELKKLEKLDEIVNIAPDPIYGEATDIPRGNTVQNQDKSHPKPPNFRKQRIITPRNNTPRTDIPKTVQNFGGEANVKPITPPKYNPKVKSDGKPTDRNPTQKNSNFRPNAKFDKRTPRPPKNDLPSVPKNTDGNPD